MAVCKRSRMIRLMLALCLALPAAAQDSFQLETEISGCFSQPVKRITRWELHGMSYTSRESAVVVSLSQVRQFRQHLLDLPPEEPRDDGFPDWDQFSPEVRRQASQKLIQLYGLRPELKDLAGGLNSKSSLRLMNNSPLFGGTEWKLSFSGQPAVRVTTSGGALPLPMLTVEKDGGKWGAFTYEVPDFLRVLEGKAPGVELEYYMVAEEGRCKALQVMQNQPAFVEWEKTFSIDDALSGGLLPKFSLFLSPRRPGPIDTILWRTGDLDCQSSLDRYSGCLAKLEKVSWLRSWKAASPDRTISLRVADDSYADLWSLAGLPGQVDHQLELHAPGGQSATVLLGDDTDLSLLTSIQSCRGVGHHWLDKTRLKGAEVVLVGPTGASKVFKLPHSS